MRPSSCSLVVLAGQALALLLQPRHTVADAARVAGAADDGGAVLVDLDAPRPPEMLQAGLVQRQPGLGGDHLPAGEHGHVLQHGLAPVAETGRLHGAALDDAADRVDHQGGQRIGLDLFGDHQQRLARLGHGLEQRHHVLQGAQLLVAQQDLDFVEHRRLPLRVVDEVRGQVAAVELQAFDHLQFADHARSILDRHGPVAADLVQRAGHQLADRQVVVGGDGGDVRDFLRRGAGLRQTLELADHGLDRAVDAALEIHRVHPRGQVLQPLPYHAVRQHRRGGGAVARHFTGARRDLAQQLGTHVLEAVLQLDRSGHHHAGVDDLGRAELALEDHGATARAERDLHRVGQGIDAAAHAVAGVLPEEKLLGCHLDTSRNPGARPRAPEHLYTLAPPDGVKVALSQSAAG